MVWLILLSGKLACQLLKWHNNLIYKVRHACFVGATVFQPEQQDSDAGEDFSRNLTGIP